MSCPPCPLPHPALLDRRRDRARRRGDRLDHRRRLPARRRRLRDAEALRRPAVRADGPPRPARPLGRGHLPRVGPPRVRARDRRAARRARRTTTPRLRLVLTRGGRRIAIIEPLPAFHHGLTLSSVRYQPTIVLNGLKTLSYGGEHARDADRAARRRRRGAAVCPAARCSRRRPRRSSGSTHEGNLHTPELDTGVLASITRERIMRLVPVTEEASYQLTTCWARPRCSSRRRCARCRACRRSTGSSSTAPGPVTQRVAGLLAERIQAEITGAISLEGG